MPPHRSRARCSRSRRPTRSRTSSACLTTRCCRGAPATRRTSSRTFCREPTSCWSARVERHRQRRCDTGQLPLDGQRTRHDHPEWTCISDDRDVRSLRLRLERPARHIRMLARRRFLRLLRQPAAYREPPIWLARAARPGEERCRHVRPDTGRPHLADHADAGHGAAQPPGGPERKPHRDVHVRLEPPGRHLRVRPRRGCGQRRLPAVLLAAHLREPDLRRARLRRPREGRGRQRRPDSGGVGLERARRHTAGLHHVRPERHNREPHRQLPLLRRRPRPPLRVRARRWGVLAVRLSRRTTTACRLARTSSRSRSWSTTRSPQEPEPTVYAWTVVDNVAPETTIVWGPSDPSYATDPETGLIRRRLRSRERRPDGHVPVRARRTVVLVTAPTRSSTRA